MNITWTGTDSLMLIDLSKRDWTKRPYWLVFRIIARFIDLYCQSHIAVNQQVKDNLVRFGMRRKITIKENPVLHPIKYPKIKHDGFNILYYFPRGAMDLNFLKWLYGYDIFKDIQNSNQEYNFIVVDGSQDMSEIYPIVDFCIRPNRHDGSPRMIRECIINDIPFYHSITNPSYTDMRIEIIYHFER